MDSNIKEIKADITTAKEGLVAHGVNCQGVMGSGVARAIRDKWPQVYRAFVNTPTGFCMLGSVDYVLVHEKLIVANCYTQEFYGRDGKVYADLLAISVCFGELFRFAMLNNDINTIYVPKIGCGLGGLSWADVKNNMVYAQEEMLYTLDINEPNYEVLVCDI